MRDEHQSGLLKFAQAQQKIREGPRPFLCTIHVAEAETGNSPDPLPEVKQILDEYGEISENHPPGLSPRGAFASVSSQRETLTATLFG